MTSVKTIFITSLFFAFWHITPAFKVINKGLQIHSVFIFFGLWFLGLLGAFGGGLLFAWVRYRSKNIAGCLLTHYLINILALLIIYYVWM
jgi:membrane protease YdiL (CAAX protease family)